MFLRHRLLAFPVVDEEGRLQGVADASLFADEMADLSDRQSAADVFQLIGVHLARTVTPWRAFRDRFPWLMCNITAGLLMAWLASAYESLLDRVILLAMFIPVVLALAESVSIQSVTITLQSMHVARPDRRFLFGAVRREVITGALLGAASGALIGLAIWLWRPEAPAGVAGTVASTIALAMLVACLLGVSVPTLVRALRRDPRIAAGPIVLALADLATLVCCFALATRLLA